MRDSRIFYARLCFILFINVQFSNATNRIRVVNPSATFKNAASLHSLFVQAPNEYEFTQHLSPKPMFLALHMDGSTLSFYESDAPYTFFTFRKKQVNFELLYAQTMIFTVPDGSNSWHFRCIFSADMNMFDTMYRVLSAATGTGSMVYRMRIDKVELYMKMDPTSDPIIDTVEDLRPAMLYDQDFHDDSCDYLRKIYSVTQLNDVDEKHPLSRLVFSTGSFQVSQTYYLTVVLQLSACPNWFYIFHFRNVQQARRFINHLTPFEVLVLPPDVKSYVNIGKLNALSISKNVSTSGESSSNSSPREGKQHGKRQRPKRPKTIYTDTQEVRLQQEFAKRRYLNIYVRKQLATELNLDEEQVKEWFQHRRDTGN